MTKRFIVTLILVIAAVSMVFAAGSQGAPDSGKKVTLRLGTTNPTGELSVQALELAAKWADERSKGTLEIQLFPASQLGSGTAMLEAASLGSLDICVDSSSYVGTFLKDRVIDSMFFTFRDKAHFRAFMQSPLNKAMEDEFRKLKGMRVVSSNWYRNPRSFVSRIAFDANSFVGMKIRVPDIKAYLESVTAMGGRCTQLAWGEVYLGLMQGVVEAAESPTDTLYDNKLHEAAKNIVLTEHLFDCLHWYMNDRAWTRLSPEHQKLLAEVANEAGDWYAGRVEGNLENALKNWRDLGINVVKIDVAPLRERVAKRVAEIEAEGSQWRKGLYQEIQNIR